MAIKIVLPNGLIVYIPRSEYRITKNGEDEEIYITSKETKSERITEPVYR